jgi:DNA-binding Xre family transcriptional regulator
MLIYKVDVMEKLAEKGIRRVDLREGKLLSQSAIHDLQHGKVVGMASLDKICGLLGCQLNSIIKWIPDEEASDGKETTDN